jgi:hypothetical protein
MKKVKKNSKLYLISLAIFILFMAKPILGQSNIVGKIHVDEKGNVTLLPLEEELKESNTNKDVINISENAKQSFNSNIVHSGTGGYSLDKNISDESCYVKTQSNYKIITINNKIIKLQNPDQIETFKKLLIENNIKFEKTNNSLYDFVLEENGLNILKRNNISYNVIGIEVIQRRNDNSSEFDIIDDSSPMYVPQSDPYIYGYNYDDVNIPDYFGGTPTLAYSGINISGATGPVTKVEYKFRVYHTYPSDLIIKLWTSEKEKTLWNRWGGTTDGGNDDDVENDDDIEYDWNQTDYFNGLNANRLWTLDCTDNALLNKGYIDNFYLRIYYQADPDLVRSGTTSISVNGSTVTYSTNVKNIGNGDAGASYIGYYASTNTTITTTDYLWADDYVMSLSPGETSPESASKDLKTVSPAIPAGDYYIGHYIDYKKEVDESDETNNTYYFSSPKANLAYTPDLVFNGTPSLSVNGSTVSVSSVVKNIGDGDAGVSYLGYYASSNTSITTNDYFWAEDYVKSLNPEETSSESESKDLKTVDPLLPAGNYYIGLLIDYVDQVTESNETNNAYYFSSPKANIAYAPNLTTYGTPVLTINDLTVNVNLTVKNTGDGNAGASRLGYYVSSNTDISTSDYLWEEDEVGSLSPGETSIESASKDFWDIIDLSAGNYYVGYIIDYNNEVSESNENDNSFSFSTPRLIHTAIDYTPNNYSLFQNYPNPFNPSTTISYDLPEHSDISLKIFDLNSKEVFSLEDELDAGHYDLNFDPSAHGLSTGIYIYTLKAGDFIETKKMVFMK